MDIFMALLIYYLYCFSKGLGWFTQLPYVICVSHMCMYCIYVYTLFSAQQTYEQYFQELLLGLRRGIYFKYLVGTREGKVPKRDVIKLHREEGPGPIALAPLPSVPPSRRVGTNQQESGFTPPRPAGVPS